MKYRLIEKAETLATAYSKGGAVYDLGSAGCDSFSVTSSNDVDTPVNKTFTAASIDIVTDIITITAHGFKTGLKGQVTNPGTLPTGISAATDYFVIYLTVDTIKLATTSALAVAGTAVDITNAGVGTNTFVVTALAGGSIKLQQTNVSSIEASWSDLGSATNITADGYVYLEKASPTARYVRIYTTLTAGSITSTLYVLGKGDRNDA